MAYRGRRILELHQARVSDGGGADRQRVHAFFQQLLSVQFPERRVGRPHRQFGDAFIRRADPSGRAGDGQRGRLVVSRHAVQERGRPGAEYLV